MGCFGRLGEQCLEDIEGAAPAQLGRLDDAGKDGDVLRSGCAACPETDFAEDHERSQGTLRVVVGRRSSKTHEGEDFPVFPRAGEKPLAQGLGLGELEGI